MPFQVVKNDVVVTALSPVSALIAVPGKVGTHWNGRGWHTVESVNGGVVVESRWTLQWFLPSSALPLGISGGLAAKTAEVQTILEDVSRNPDCGVVAKDSAPEDTGPKPLSEYGASTVPIDSRICTCGHRMDTHLPYVYPQSGHACRRCTTCGCREPEAATTVATPTPTPTGEVLRTELTESHKQVAALEKHLAIDAARIKELEAELASARHDFGEMTSYLQEIGGIVGLTAGQHVKHAIPLVQAAVSAQAKLAMATAESESLREIVAELNAFDAPVELSKMRDDLNAAKAELSTLRTSLSKMEARKDAAYTERNRVVSALAACAVHNGWNVGIRKTNIEGWSEDWHHCVYLDLPTGQVSWHYHDSQVDLFSWLPEYTKPYDGHTAQGKANRLAYMRELPHASPSRARRIIDAAEKVIRHIPNFSQHEDIQTDLLILQTELNLPADAPDPEAVKLVEMLVFMKQQSAGGIYCPNVLAEALAQARKVTGLKGGA